MLPLRLRVSFDSKSEAKDAQRLAKKLMRFLEKNYVVEVSKIYWNLRDKEKGAKDYGGRIYMNLKPRPESKKRTKKESIK